jgi:SAM-dependent methyltransferase
MRVRLLNLLRCQACGGALVQHGEDARSGGVLHCARCGHDVPVSNGIPRFVTDPGDELGRRTQASFGYEWTVFRDWSASDDTSCAAYFEGVDLPGLRRSVVLDAGCGMGRHTRYVARHAGAILALDFSRAIDRAATNVRQFAHVQCIQADLTQLPLADAAFDFVYSLGVLHHIADTQAAVRQLVAKVKPGGRLRVYVYWKRRGWSGRLLSLVAAVRRVTTRTPFPALKAFCWVLSAGLFAGAVWPYRVLTRLGVTAHASWPLFVYSKYPFAALYNDQFDRFSAPLEKRYDPDEVRQLLESAGLDEVRIIGRFGWIGEGVRPMGA